MEYYSFSLDQLDTTIALYTDVFAAAEGQAVGESIGQLVRALVTTSAERDLYGYIAKDGNTMVGGIFFSRFSTAHESTIFMLSPVAVANDYHGQGVGQALIAFGLQSMTKQGVDIVVTYGDPAFYSKSGFAPLDENKIKAPFPLSQPVGWQAVALNGKPIPIIAGATQCVDAFNNPKHW
ncbi:N-acetyltransferase [Alteromonas sp. ASW11-36]|uniref:N-acetyltransferase n=1 Tax=Alteromonas arenosi TaxID=3055817 RepID=A0ABT7T1M8_9ALTE|nr:N-acetyltransferase [Alteromonas sp. ASW11-36]MDM7862321.1 N-acetyltransferase [Alteromonas sp. ASW11-36]